MSIKNKRTSELVSGMYTLVNTLDAYDVEEVDADDFARLFPDIALNTAEPQISTESRGAYSRPNWKRIPVQSGRPFETKLDSDSGPNWTLVPI